MIVLTHFHSEVNETKFTDIEMDSGWGERCVGLDDTPCMQMKVVGWTVLPEAKNKAIMALFTDQVTALQKVVEE